MPKKVRIPSYRLHKGSGQAVVVLKTCTEKSPRRRWRSVIWRKLLQGGVAGAVVATVNCLSGGLKAFAFFTSSRNSVAVSVAQPEGP